MRGLLIAAALLAAACGSGGGGAGDGGDLAAGGGAPTDGAVTFPCGDLQCATSEICKLQVTSGEQCLLPTDAGTCPPGTQEGRFTQDCPPGALNCDPIPFPPHCSPLPADCGGAPGCACLRLTCLRTDPDPCTRPLAIGSVYCWTTEP